MPRSSPLRDLHERVIACRKCPRLVEYLQQVDEHKRASYRDQEYWSKPVPGFGDPRARLHLVGLAPGAHGANRTGRVFTGDRSGEFLFASLHRLGLANQPDSIHRGDGLKLKGVYISSVLRCAPPANKPRPDEVDRCLDYLVEEMRILRSVRVLTALGRIAYDGIWAAWRRLEVPLPDPRPAFGHNVLVPGEAGRNPRTSRPSLVLCYHPSQQNTQTGRLTPKMLDAALGNAWTAATG
jgi:uracil-DNA glycosylase